VTEAEKSLVVDALKTLRECLKLKDATLIRAGACITDPMGFTDWYVSFRSEDDGYYFGVADNGRITKAGAYISGKNYQVPERTNMPES
jgi:hypothetical protein